MGIGFGVILILCVCAVFSNTYIFKISWNLWNLWPLKPGEFNNHSLKTPGPSWLPSLRNMSILWSEIRFIHDVIQKPLWKRTYRISTAPRNISDIFSADIWYPVGRVPANPRVYGFKPEHLSRPLEILYSSLCQIVPLYRLKKLTRSFLVVHVTTIIGCRFL